MNFDLKAAIGTIAPTLATMLGGPLAGTAVAALAGAFGLTGSASADDVTKVVQAGMTPDTIAAVRAADQKHLEIMAQQQIDVQKLNDDFITAQIKIAADDRNSARTNNVGGGVQKHVFWLSMLLLAVTLGAELFVLFQGYPKTLPELVVGRVLGLLDAVAMTVLAYWFGTTHGSQEKNALLAAAPAKPV